MTWYDNPGLQGTPPQNSPENNSTFNAVFSSTVKPKKGSAGKETDKVCYWQVKLTIVNGKVTGTAQEINEDEYNKLTRKKPKKKEKTEEE